MIKEFYYQPINEDDEDIDIELEGNEEDMSDNEDTTEIELDVTDIVKTQEEILSKIDELIIPDNNENIEKKINKTYVTLKDFETFITKRLKELESEIEYRLPTKREKLVLRGLNSFPFNQNLEQYWYGSKNVTPAKDEKPEDEIYELKTGDIKTYSDNNINSSF